MKTVSTIEAISEKATRTAHSQRGYIAAAKESVNGCIKAAFKHDGEWLEVVTVYPRKTSENYIKRGQFVPIR